MGKSEIMEILEDLRFQVQEISSKVNKIYKCLNVDVEIKEIKLQKNEYYETEIPEIDELDRRNMKKKEDWAKEIY